jgi:hypothetical protein
VFHKFATPEEVQTHLINYTLKGKLNQNAENSKQEGSKDIQKDLLKT